MVEKRCSDKSKYKDDPRYICNPRSGRYVLRTGPTGRKILNNNKSKKKQRTQQNNKRSRKKKLPVRIDVEEAVSKGVRRLIFEISIIRLGFVRSDYIDREDNFRERDIHEYIKDIVRDVYEEEIHTQDINDYIKIYMKKEMKKEEIKLLNQIKYLIDDYSNNYIGPWGINRNSCLHLTCLHGHLDIAKLLLKSRNIDPEYPNIYGETPLHLAVESNNKKLVKYLIDYGFDVNAQDIYEATPLHYAIEKNNVDIVKLLINYGNADTRGQHLLHMAIKARSGYVEARSGYIELIKFLIDFGIDVNTQDDSGRTPLHLVRYNDGDIIKLLLSYGADPYIQDVNGYTALHGLAINENYEGIEQLLLNSRVNPNIFPDNNGETPLQFIVRLGLFTSQEIDDIIKRRIEGDYQRNVQLSRAVENANKHLPQEIFRKIDEYLFERRK